MVKQNKILGRTNLIDKKAMIDKVILNLAKKKKHVIYGARSIEAQAGLFSRDTSDYDILSKTPKKDAKILKNKLNKLMQLNYFYTKPAKHKGTWKVKGLGMDFKKDTEDDESIADYTRHFTGLPDNVETVTKNGVKYRHLKYELKRKVAVTKDPEYAFRKEKDKDDIKRIKGYLKVKHIVGGEVG